MNAIQTAIDDGSLLARLRAALPEGETLWANGTGHRCKTDDPAIVQDLVDQVRTLAAIGPCRLSTCWGIATEGRVTFEIAVVPQDAATGPEVGWRLDTKTEAKPPKLRLPRHIAHEFVSTMDLMTAAGDDLSLLEIIGINEAPSVAGMLETLGYRLDWPIPEGTLRVDFATIPLKETNDDV